jgi:rfaE bifunctional protein nucleotidyltransferase chain/domain
VTVTEGARGAVFAGPHGNVLPIPVPRESRTTWQHGDTCGAGDRFASAAAAAVLRGASMPDAVAEAVEAAAQFVAAGGAAALSAYEAVEGTAKTYRPGEPGLTAIEVASRVRRRGGRLVATGGCFDLLHPGHASLLRQARALGDALIVCLNSDRSVRGIKGPGRPLVPARDRARLLTALESVDAVAVFDEPTPAALLERLRPDVWVKGGDYAGTDIPEAEVVRRTGGEVVLVPTVSGYSTSRLVDAAHSSR